MNQGIKVGLRFNRHDTKLLQHLTARAQNDDLGKQAASFFATAARACERGEAMELRCDDLEDARIFAALYTQFGVTHPTIEQGSGIR